MGELFEPGKHPTSVEGGSGVVRENGTVPDENMEDGQADSVESNDGFVNGEQGE
jgi:hypothetical protein